MSCSEFYFFLSLLDAYLSCLIALSRISNTVLNGSGESWHSFLVSDLGGIVFSLLPLSLMFAVGFNFFASIMLS